MAVSTVANKNVNLPILSNVLIKAEPTAIHLVSTNLEIAVRCAVRGKVEVSGEYTFPSKLLLDYVNLLPEDRVDMELDGDSLKIACRKNSTKMKGIPASEFPLIPQVEGQSTFFLSVTKLRKALQQVNFAISRSESRPELTGAFFNFNPDFAPGKLVIAATDSYRLSEKTVGLDADAGQASASKQLSVIVPGRTLGELARILSVYKDEEIAAPVRIMVGEGQVAFRFGDIELLSRVVDGKYPPYRPIIPERFVTEASFSRNDLAQAVKSAALFSRAGLQDVHFRLKEGGVAASSDDGQTGKNESVTEAAVSGPENEITLNFRYFLDGLTAIDSGRAKLKIIDAANPCVIAPEDETPDDRLIYVVMPIKQ